MPLVALVPLLTVWFGYTPLTRLVVVVIEAVLPIIFSVAEGARSLPAQFTDVARAYRAPWWRVWTGIVLPASLPYLLGGIDLAIGRALVGAVVAEFIASLNGLGYYILFNVRSFQEDRRWWPSSCSSYSLSPFAGWSACSCAANFRGTGHEATR